MLRAAVGLVLATAAAPGASLAAQADTVSSALVGTIRGSFEGASAPLAHALVEVVAPDGVRSVEADSLGRYRVEGLRPGEVRLRARHAGHESVTLTVFLPAGEAVQVDVELAAAPVELSRLDVVGDRTRPEAIERHGGVTEAAPVEMEVLALDITPGVGEPGLLSAIQALPGNDPANPSDVLFMRGSTTDLKLVLLDGVPVYTPFHVAGLLRSFEPSVIERAELHVGGAPARYDGGLTHILDIGTRRARRDRLRLSGSADLLSATVSGETPLGSAAGLLVSGRSLHDVGTRPLGGSRPYGYRDAFVAVDVGSADGHALRATGFLNAESVRLDYELLPGDAEWSNRAASLSYQGRFGGTTLEVTAGGSGYRAELPLQPVPTNAEPDPTAVLASANVDRARVVAEARWAGADGTTRAGVSFDHIDAVYGAVGSEGSTWSSAVTSTPGAFIDIARSLGPGVSARVGLRGDLFEGGAARLGPRAALHLDVGPQALLTIAGGRYHQPTRSPDFEVERTLTAVVDDAVGSDALLPVATADHVVLSLDQRLGTRTALGIEGFWKRFEGLASDEETIRSSGLDLRVSGGGAGGVLWLGYGLAWYWSTIDLSGHAADFAGRHLLSAGASGRIGGPISGEFRIAYGAGLPYTAIPFGRSDDLTAAPVEIPDQDPGPGPETLSGSRASPLSGGLDEEFLRIDLELYALVEPVWGGRPWRIRPYVRILNALDRRDALFYTFQPWRPDSVRPLAQRSFLPLFGASFSF